MMIPPELKELPIWAVRKEKVPHHPNGHHRASSTDPSTWVSFEEAEKAMGTGEFDGIGLFLNPATQPFGIFCVDLDHMRDKATGVLHPVAEDIIQRLDTFTEISQSGTGIHIFGLFQDADFPHTKVKLDDQTAIEIYTKSRFIAMTGGLLPGTNTNFETRTQELRSVYEKYIAPHYADRPMNLTPAPVGGSDIDIDKRLELAYRSKSGPAIQALMSGDISSYRQDESAADMALCMYLAFWFERRADLIAEVFGRSALGTRKKWRSRPDYQNRTIKAAIRATTEVYDPTRNHRQELRTMTHSTEQGEVSSTTTLAPGFSLLTDGVYYTPPPVIGKNGQREEQDPVWICSPLHVSGRVREKTDTGKGTNYGIYLTWTDEDGCERSWAMPEELLHGDGLPIRQQLAANGVKISVRKAHKEPLLRYLSETRSTNVIRCVTKVGWNDGVYVMPERTIGKTNEQIVLQSPLYMEGYDGAGTLKEWREHVAALCVGNSRLIMALSAAFASAIAGLVESETGGIHLYGTSSTGKTTALHVAASAWGLPKKFVLTWRNTTNALEGRAAAHNDGLLILDEIGQADAKTIGDAIYLLFNGQGKGRMNSAGMMRKSHSFRVTLLSSGEHTLASYMRTADKITKGGQEVRMISVSAHCSHGVFDVLHGRAGGAELSALLKTNCAKYHGTAIPAFVQRAVADPETTTRLVRESVIWFRKQFLPAGAEGEVGRVCDQMAMIAAGGAISTVFGITGWNPGEVFSGVGRCFQDWVAERGTLGSVDVDNGIRQVKLFLESHGASRYSSINTAQSPIESAELIINRAGYKEFDTGDKLTYYYTLAEVFIQEICKGHDHRLVAESLASRGLLKSEGGGRLTTRIRVPGLGRTRVYAISSTIFEE